MSDKFKTQLLWYYTKTATNIELWYKNKDKDKEDFCILSIYKLKNYKNELVNKKKYVFYKNKLSINCNDNDQNFLIKFKFKNSNFRIILNNYELKSFDFNFIKVEEPKYLSVLSQENEDITDIINQYSGPERDFYLNKLDFNLERIYQDTDFKTESDQFKIVNNLADEKEINNIKNFIN